MRLPERGEFGQSTPEAGMFRFVAGLQRGRGGRRQRRAWLLGAVMLGLVAGLALLGALSALLG